MTGKYCFFSPSTSCAYVRMLPISGPKTGHNQALYIFMLIKVVGTFRDEVERNLGKLDRQKEGHRTFSLILLLAETCN